MRTLAAIAMTIAAIGAVICASPADAQGVSRCVDANGHVYLTQGGPPDGVRCAESSPKDLEPKAPSPASGLHAQSEQGAISPRVIHARESRDAAQSVRPGVPPKDAWTCPVTQPIKGDFTPYTQERCIYHPPTGEFYRKTKPERCYATGDDARQDGCRASRR
jgi:hypothetical protein